MGRRKNLAMSVAAGALFLGQANAAIVTVCADGLVCDSTSLSGVTSEITFDTIPEFTTNPTRVIGGNTVNFGGQFVGQSFTRVAMPLDALLVDPDIDYLAGNVGPVDPSFSFQPGPLPTDPAPHGDAPTPTEVVFDATRLSNTLTGFGFRRNFTATLADDTLLENFGPISMVFDQPVSAVGGIVGELNTAGSVMLVVFDINGNPIGSVDSTVVLGVGGSDGFELIALQEDTGDAIIYGASFFMVNQPLGDEEGFAVDSLILNDQSVIPVPASLALLGMGLGGLGWQRRRRRRQ